jgi:PAS domain S-box-containing protein
MQRREFITFLGAAAAVWKRAKRPTALLHEAGHLLLGLVSLATVTGLYFWLDIPLVAAASTYLVVLVLLSLVSNLSSLILLSFIGVCCLSYFFAPPIYSFRVDYAQDLITISAFAITSFIVNFLVTRVRVEQEALRDANQRLEITNEALRIEIVERKRAEQALQESEHRLRQIIDTVPGLIWSIGPDGELSQINQGVLDYSGMRFEDHLGFYKFHHPDDFSGALNAFYHSMQTGTFYQALSRLRRADGEYRWHQVRAQPLCDREGRIVQWYGLSVDIDDLKRAEQALQEEHERLCQLQSDLAHMNRLSMMGELAASLAHEITQPIASARNNARAAQNFLDRQPPDLSEVREALSCVVGDTDRAGDIVDRIRDHIKKTPPRKENFDLNEAINEVMVLGRSAITKNGVSVQTGLSEGLFPIHCDRVQLQQVVLNLILNAAEAMGSVEAEPRELLISTEQHHTGVLVAVRDSGPGIDPTHLERVFETFYTTKSHGVGMGLSICRSIIDAHGGRLWAEANEPRGTIFQFTLPAA